MIQCILVPTDGSKNARRAEKLGAELAARFDARLVLAHAVIEQPTEDDLGGMGEVIGAIGPQPVAPLHMENLAEQIGQATGREGLRSHADAFRALGEHLLEDAARRCKEAGASNVETRLFHGRTSDGIVELGDELDVDLIVMGTRGIGGLRGRLMGSATKRVLEHTRHNTLVVKEGEDDQG